jgi:hypothetical protein
MIAWSWSPHDAIGVSTSRQGAMHRILPHQVHNQTHRRDKKIINDSEYDFGIDRSENVADLHPSTVNLFQALRYKTTKNNEQTTESYGPQARRLTPEHKRPQSDHCKHTSNQESKLSQVLRGRLLTLSIHYILS